MPTLVDDGPSVDVQVEEAVPEPPQVDSPIEAVVQNSYLADPLDPESISVHEGTTVAVTRIDADWVAITTKDGKSGLVPMVCLRLDGPGSQTATPSTSEPRCGGVSFSPGGTSEEEFALEKWEEIVLEDDRDTSTTDGKRRRSTQLLQVPVKEILTTFQPGMLGLRLERANGRVLEVDPAGEAYHQGVRLGWVMHEVDGEPYTDELFLKAREGYEEYIVTWVDEARGTTCRGPLRCMGPSMVCRG
jgi:hypothetical protein